MCVGAPLDFFGLGQPRPEPNQNGQREPDHVP